MKKLNWIQWLGIVLILVALIALVFDPFETDEAPPPDSPMTRPDTSTVPAEPAAE